MRIAILRTVAVTTMLASAVSLALSPPAPPKRYPPIGWEERTTAGFDPPIEYAVVYAPPRYGGALTDEQRTIAAKWGSGAGEVLIRLYDAPGWQAYRYDILDWLDCVEFPNLSSFYIDAIKKIMDDPNFNNPADTTTKNFGHNLMGRLRRHDLPAAEAVVEEGLRNVNSPNYSFFVTHLMSFMGTGRSDNHESKLREIAISTNDNQLRLNIEETLKRHEAYKRAQEPMARVLEQERAEGRAR